MDIAIVTGASSGLGMEFARQIGNTLKIDEIWLIARRKDRLEQLAKELKNSKGFVLQADLTKNRDIWKIVAKIKKEKPEIKLLVNNAGFGKFGMFRQVSFGHYMDMIDLNVKALVQLTYEALPYMKRGSKIIQVASAAAYIPLPYNSVYAATKSFVLSLTNALAAELKSEGIHAMAVCPGPVNTEFFEVFSGGKLRKSLPGVQPREVVRTALNDLKKNKWVSVHGMPMKATILATRIFPRKMFTLLAKGIEGRRQRK